VSFGNYLKTDLGVFLMKRASRFAILLTAMVIFTPHNKAWTQEDKTPPEKWVPSVELTDKAGKWLLKEAKTGTKMLADRDYLLTDLPKEIAGGTYVMRTSGEYGTWLPDASLKAKKDATVYAIIRLKYLGKETFDELAQEQLKKDGWEAVEGKVATTFPAGEKWEWKAYKKGIKEGTVILQLENLTALSEKT
jgi:hypothetical protein